MLSPAQARKSPDKMKIWWKYLADLDEEDPKLRCGVLTLCQSNG